MSQWPLVGRADELRRLERLLRDPSRPGVVLAGPAGAGKTRLASACLELAEGAGAATARATATHSAATVPFGALSALLPPSDQTGAASSDRTELLRRLVEELVGRAGKRRVELVEDRVESLSPEERTVLEYLSFAEPLGAAELGTILAPDVAEQLESRGLVTSSLDGRRVQIRLAHPIYGDVLRSRIPALRSTKMARALAEVVEANRAQRREDILCVAS